MLAWPFLLRKSVRKEVLHRPRTCVDLRCINVCAGASLLSPVIGATDRARQVAWGTPAAASPRPAGFGLPLPPIQDIRARAMERR